MTREEAIQEVKKAFEPAFANYIIIALTEGATVSDRCEDAVSRKAVLDMAKSYNTDGYDSYTPLVVDVEDIEELPSVTPTKSKCEKLADGINPADYSFTHYARLTPEEAEHDLFRLDRETGEYIPLTDNTNYALPETSEQFKDIKQAVIQGCANMMKAVGEKL